MQFDSYGRPRRERLIVLLQSPPHFAGLYANNGIVACRVSGSPLEEFGPNGSLFQLLGMTLQLVANDVLQELTAA